MSKTILNYRLDLQNHDGNTALMIAVDKCILPIVEELISYGAGLDIQNRHGQTALMIASGLNSNLQIATLLVRSGARLDLLDRKGQTAMCLAEIYQNRAVAAMLATATQANATKTDTNQRLPTLL